MARPSGTWPRIIIDQAAVVSASVSAISRRSHQRQGGGDHRLLDLGDGDEPRSVEIETEHLAMDAAIFRSPDRPKWRASRSDEHRLARAFGAVEAGRAGIMGSGPARANRRQCPTGWHGPRCRKGRDGRVGRPARIRRRPRRPSGRHRPRRRKPVDRLGMCGLHDSPPDRPEIGMIAGLLRDDRVVADHAAVGNRSVIHARRKGPGIGSSGSQQTRMVSCRPAAEPSRTNGHGRHGAA